MSHPQRRRCAVAGLALLLLATLSACVTNPQPASSPTLAPVTARALAALVEQHFGPGASAYADGEDEAVVLYGTDPWAPTREVRMTYGEAPWWATNDAACRDAGTGTPPVQCALRHGVRIGWQAELDTVWVASPRARGVVTAALGNVRLSQDPRQGELPEEYPATVRVSRAIPGGHLVITHTSQHADAKTRRFPVPLETLLTLAGDDRFGFTVDPALNRAGDDLSVCWRLIEPTGG